MSILREARRIKKSEITKECDWEQQGDLRQEARRMGAKCEGNEKSGIRARCGNTPALDGKKGKRQWKC